MRSERALKLALAEMYVQGVSTRKVASRIRAIFTAPDQSEEERLLKAFICDSTRRARQSWSIGLTQPFIHRRQMIC